nr:unnamed protein product [Callosobruchus chinensis]
MKHMLWQTVDLSTLMNVYRRKKKFVRPPSVSSKIKNCRQEVKQSKRFGSLRIYIKSDIKTKGVRHLEPSASIHWKLIKYLDNIVIALCASINLQDRLLKKAQNIFIKFYCK